ncbi:MAG TPA: alpha/beta fold hydrolase [Thermoanaerobaculia bacterium]|nr:alpha/beta fold hydrolase [Thermoanaerobaculia bacterium]
MNSRTWKIFISVCAIAALAHCNTTDRTRRGYLRANAAHLGAPPRPVIVIAGFGVTRLVDPVTGRHVWGTPRAVWQRTFPDDLDLDANDRLIPVGWVGSRGPINTGWQLSIGLRKFGGYTEGRDLHPFYYDWRRSARDNARLLDALIERVRGNGSVDLVTHSAGAMVALASQSEHVENIVMVAPVRRGSLEAFRVFMRPERFIRRTFTPDVVATWPFVFELLPENGRVFVDERGRALDRDLWDPKTWPVDVRQQLTDARAFRESLKTPKAKLHVIAGDCVPTAIRVLARSDGTYAFYPNDLRENEQHLATVLFEPGDGTVPVSSAKAGGEAMLFCDGHQGIAADPSVHRAIIRALRE